MKRRAADSRRLSHAYPGAAVRTTRPAREAVRGAAPDLTRMLTPLAFAALGVCAVAVAKLLLADLRARRHTFGVMCATGASRGAVARLVLGQALVLGVAACGLGAALGYQLAYCARGLHARLFGLDYPLAAVWDIFGWAALATFAAAALAAVPGFLMIARPAPVRLLADE